jgi:thioredoxin-like negative regulator of GroEL|tara:strand:+ start:90 stop:476 length:387 start_codon:yes stop_codon:yes gene_type:complete
MLLKEFILSGFLVISCLFSQSEIGNEMFHKGIAQGISIVYFNAEWNSSNDIVDTLETIGDYEQSTLYYIDINNNLELKEKYRAKRIPMVILIHDGRVVKTWRGSLRNTLDLDPEEIKEKIDELLEEVY